MDAEALASVKKSFTGEKSEGVYHWLFLVLFFIGSEIFCDE
jgi:hypothetical protein